MASSTRASAASPLRQALASSNSPANPSTSVRVFALIWPQFRTSTIRLKRFRSIVSK
jgi:hypothetical protein